MKTPYDKSAKIYTKYYGHMTKMAATPIYGKIFQKSSSPEPKGQWPWDLVCLNGDVGPTKFVQMMILGWPWPTKCQGQVCFLMHLNGKLNWKVDFLITVEAKVIILTWYVQSSGYK